MMKLKHWIGLGTAVFSDTVVEVLGGIIPIVGDVIDLAQIGIHIYIFGARLPALPATIEFVPIIGDILPMHTASAVWAILDERKN